MTQFNENAQKLNKNHPIQRKGPKIKQEMINNRLKMTQFNENDQKLNKNDPIQRK